MSILSGPRLDARLKYLTQWYAEERQELIKALTQEYPYGATKLTNIEQYTRFLGMTTQDYTALVASLNDKYRGLPNSLDLVNKDLASFMQHMIGLMLEASSGGQSQEVPAVTQPSNNTIPQPPGYQRLVNSNG